MVEFFFHPDTMKAYHDTMKGFSISTLPSGNIEVRRKNGKGRWEFSPATGRVVHAHSMR